MIYNILKIAVSQRVRQYGALRAIGAEKGQLYTVVSVEILLLCVVGIPLGASAGLAVRQGYPERRAEPAVAGDVPGAGYRAAAKA